MRAISALRWLVPFCIILFLSGCGDDDPVQPTPTAPSTPTEFSAGTVTPNSVTLTWKAPTELLRGSTTKPTSGGGSLLSLAGYTLSYADTTITGIDKSAVSFTVTGLTAQTTYTFTLKAVSTDGLASESATFNVTTPAVPIIPAPPTNFLASNVHPTEIELMWTASASATLSEFAGYVLSYNGQTVMLDATTTAYTVTELNPSTQYTFLLKARTTALESTPAELTVTTAPEYRPQAPVNLRIQGSSSMGISLLWTAPDDVELPDFAGYELTYSPGGATPVMLDKNLTSYTVNGLTAGTMYTLTLKSRSVTGTFSEGQNISWSPSVLSQVFRLYGSTSQQGQGLDLDGDNGSPVVLPRSNPGEWDIAFDDTDAYSLGLGSPGQTMYVNDQYKYPNGTVSKLTRVSTSRYEANSFDEIINNEPLEATFEQLQVIEPNADKGFAFVVKTEEGNYAKVLVLSNNGKIVQGSGADKYIEVQISYQPVPNLPFALKDMHGNRSKKTTLSKAKVLRTTTVMQKRAGR